MTTRMDSNYPDFHSNFFSISYYHHEPTIPHVYICFDQQMLNGKRARSSTIQALLFHHGHKDEWKEQVDKDVELEKKEKKERSGRGKGEEQKLGLEIDPTTYHQISQSASYYDEFSPAVNLDALSVDSDGESSLLDDDPFADLSSPPASPRSPLIPLPSIPLPSHLTLPQSTIPKRHSPLSPTASQFPESRIQLLPTPKQKSLGTKASLPTLNTLAEMNVVIPKRARKGKVGANLPLDPWETGPESLSNESGTAVKAPARPPLTRHHSSLSIPNLLELALHLHNNTNAPRDDKRPSSSHFGSLFRKDKRKSSPLPSPSLRSEPFFTITTTPPTIESSSSSSDSSTGDGASTPFTSPALSENEDKPEPKRQLHRQYRSTDEQDLPSYDKFNHPLPQPLSSDSLEHEMTYFSLNPPSSDILERDNYLSLKNWASDATLRLPSPGRPLTVARRSSMDVNFGHDDDDDDDQYYLKSEHSHGDDQRSMFSRSCSSWSSSSQSYRSISGDSHSHECWSDCGSSSRISVDHGHDSAASQYSQYFYEEEEPVDGDGKRERSGYSGYNGYSGYGSSNGHSTSSYSQSRSGHGFTGSNGRSDGHGGDDDEDPYDPRRPSIFDSTSDSEPEEEEEEEDSDDDVPLAQSHPTALRAQQSIRMKDKQRRKERKLRERSAPLSPLPPSPLPPSSNTMSSSQEAAALALAQAVPSQSKSEPAIGPGTMLNDTTTLPPSLPAGTVRLRTQRGRTRTNTISNGAPPPNLQQANAPLPPPTTEKTLRPMRSFHRPRPQNQAEYSHTSLDRSRSQRVPSQQQQLYDQVQVPAVPPLPSTRSRSRPPAVRTAVDEFGAMGLGGGANEIPSRRSNDLPPPRKSTDLPPPRKSTDLPPPRKSTDTVGSRRSGRSSMDHNRPEVPPVELMPALPANLKTTQQRIYIGDRQRFVVIETNQHTNAGEVIDTLERRGELKDWRGTGGWMLWEVAQDLGIERPTRSFELLSDIEASWNRDKTVNIWMVRLTPWEPVLSRSALPSSSPTCSGYVEYEVRRGKWSKRWLVLREHGLYISKRDNCKDEQLLCALSNFDAYHITRLLKAPKEYTFAIKSTEKMSLFEDTSDYMHLFSCKTKDGEKWMERILLARSYVLYQERHILFAPKTASGAVPTSLTGAAAAGASLSRAPTKRRPMPDKPLLQVGGNDIFAPGSLLRGQVGQ